MIDPPLVAVFHTPAAAAGDPPLAAVLRAAGWRVEERALGAQASDPASATADLVVVRAGPADPDGLGLCRLLRTDPATAAIPLLHVSADGQGPAEADACLPAHVAPAELLATVRGLLRARQGHRRAWAATRQWQAIFDALGDGVALLDPHGTVLRCNRALAALLGRPFAEILGRPHDELVPRPLAAGPGRPFPRMLRSLRRETAELDLGGRWFRVTADPVFAPDGGLDGAAYILADITEQVEARHQAEAHAARAHARDQALADADRRKDEFLAQLAHEMRGPLAPLFNALHLLRLRGPDPAVAGPALDLAERQVRQLSRLVDDLLDVSRIARGKLRLCRERVDARRVVADAVETARPLLEARRHELNVLVPPEPLWLEADPARLVQVLANLLTNAAKYTPEGGHVWVSAEHDGGDVLLKVRDDGVGLAPELVPHLFGLFVQAEPGSQGGLGIGLALARGLVEMHSGTVLAFSDGPGEGSEFVVRLPAPVAEPAARPPISPVVEGVPARRLRVLVVDDDVDGAGSLALLLGLWGYEARVAHDGYTAVEAARAFRPEVVLLDLGLPGGLDGFAVAERLREFDEAARTWIVVLTGRGQEEDRRRSREAGIDHHLVKPVDPLDLQRLLARLGAGG